MYDQNVQYDDKKHDQNELGREHDESVQQDRDTLGKHDPDVGMTMMSMVLIKMIGTIRVMVKSIMSKISTMVLSMMSILMMSMITIITIIAMSMIIMVVMSMIMISMMIMNMMSSISMMVMSM
jgi:hypothetical protein